MGKLFNGITQLCLMKLGEII